MAKSPALNAFLDELSSDLAIGSQSEKYNIENNPQGEEPWDLFSGSKFHNPLVGILILGPSTSLP